MTIVTDESQKLRDKLAYLERKLDYGEYHKQESLIMKLESLIEEINAIEN
jgi:hypothetical protein